MQALLLLKDIRVCLILDERRAIGEYAIACEKS
jgi:hypothetical protein